MSFTGNTLLYAIIIMSLTIMYFISLFFIYCLGGKSMFSLAKSLAKHFEKNKIFNFIWIDPLKFASVRFLFFNNLIRLVRKSLLKVIFEKNVIA